MPPSKAQIDREVKAAQKRAAEMGRVAKVLFLDDEGKSVGEYASSQIQENPWAGHMSAGLVEPPFPLEQLVYLAEMHPTHSSALEQKTLDICGKGWEWKARDEDNADDAYKEELDEWFEGLSPDDVDMREVIQAVELDVETLGWGTMEILRDPQGLVQKVYHVPAHTIRAHRDGFRLAQVRDNRKVWFKRWGAPLWSNNKPVMVNSKTGAITTSKVPQDLANDMLVIRKGARRSSWYGIPNYISAIGWITLALAARDDNLFFFSNRREPRWAIILENISDDPNMQEDLRRSMTVDLRQPYRNLIIPITGPGKIDFQKLTDNRMDGSFSELDDRASHHIMVAHRVPAERIANAETGPLGGNIANEANRIYKEAVVMPGQELLNSRLNRFLEVEYTKVRGEVSPDGKRVRLPWMIEMDDLDLGTDREELDLAAIAFHSNMITLREARAKIKLEPLMTKVKAANDPVTGLPPVDPVTGGPLPMTEPETDDGQPLLRPDGTPAQVGDEVESPLNDKLFTELPGSAGGAGSPGAPPPGSGGLAGSPVKAARESDLQRLDVNIRKLYAETLETQKLLRRAEETDAASYGPGAR